MNKPEIIAYMQSCPICYLATVEGNAPRVRAIMIYKVNEREIIIQTNEQKEVSLQMLKNPNIELLFYNAQKPEMMQIRVRGTAEPVTDALVIKQVMEERPFLKEAKAQGNGPSIYRVRKPRACVWTMLTNNDPKTFVEL